ncbi:hypothetical protein RRG08_064223 [Elysia crispata]|uniref:Uncharacterized protein n=1 Tax=Elysia crispata TaxID=231223 RepID=A0AAE1CXD4_9GAST|nr:hypothetical protein RRG08_064223 [Elysia crispata]
MEARALTPQPSQRQLLHIDFFSLYNGNIRSSPYLLLSVRQDVAPLHTRRLYQLGGGARDTTRRSLAEISLS